MIFLRKSLFWKLFLYLVFFAVLLGVMSVGMSSVGYEFITLETLILILGIFVVLFALTFLFSVIRPLKSVLHEMQLMLTGRKYRRIYTKRIDEVGIISHFFNEVTESLGSMAGNIEEQRRLTSELGLAAELQQNILPSQTPAMPGLSVVIRTRSAAEVGGDSFDFISAPDRTYMYIGDVTGHGVPAALVMTMAHALVRVFAESKKDAYEIIVETNKHLKQHIGTTMFMTMLFLTWDHKTESLSYVGAGHEYLLLFNSATGKCERLSSGGIALGMVPDNSKLTKEVKVKLNEGDSLLLFTDGVVEGRNETGEMYEIDRLEKSFVQYAASGYDANMIHKSLAVDFAKFVGKAIQEDDITLMVIQRVEGAQNASSTEWQESDGKAAPAKKKDAESGEKDKAEPVEAANGENEDKSLIEPKLDEKKAKS